MEIIRRERNGAVWKFIYNKILPTGGDECLDKIKKKNFRGGPLSADQLHYRY